MSHENDSAAYRRDAELSALFAAYREACPDPEPSANFTPAMWAKIEARQTFVHSLKRFAQGIVTAAAAASLVMGAYLYGPDNTHNSPVYQNSYLELLANEQSMDNPANAEIVQALYERNR
jgi:hypothetical protein